MEKRLLSTGNKHPSGKPIRHANKRGWGDGYTNRIGYKTERLRPGSSTNAIGFLHSFEEEEDFNE